MSLLLQWYVHVPHRIIVNIKWPNNIRLEKYIYSLLTNPTRVSRTLGRQILEKEEENQDNKNVTFSRRLNINLLELLKY